MEKGGDGGKAGDHGVDAIEGAEQATLSTCGEWTAMDKAGNDGFGTWRPESSRKGRRRAAVPRPSTQPVQENPGGRPERPRETEGEER